MRASVRGAVFAKNYEREKKTGLKNAAKETYNKLPSYALVSINIPGVRRNSADIFDFTSSRRVSPPLHNRQNIPITEIELERLTLVHSPKDWPHSDDKVKIIPLPEKIAKNNADKFTEPSPISHGIYLNFHPGFDSPHGVLLYSYTHRL